MSRNDTTKRELPAILRISVSQTTRNLIKIAAGSIIIIIIGFIITIILYGLLPEAPYPLQLSIILISFGILFISFIALFISIFGLLLVLCFFLPSFARQIKTPDRMASDIEEKPLFWTKRRVLIIILGLWIVLTLLFCIYFYPDVWNEVDNPTFTLPGDRTARILVISLLLIVLGGFSSFFALFSFTWFIIFPFSVIYFFYIILKE